MPQIKTNAILCLTLDNNHDLILDSAISACLRASSEMKIFFHVNWEGTSFYYEMAEFNFAILSSLTIIQKQIQTLRRNYQKEGGRQTETHTLLSSHASQAKSKHRPLALKGYGLETRNTQFWSGVRAEISVSSKD